MKIRAIGQSTYIENVRGESLVAQTSSSAKSSISGAPASSIWWKMPEAFFRMCTFLFSLVLFRTPRVQPFYLPELTTEKRTTYKKELSSHWLYPWQVGPTHSQQIELYHQLNSFITTLPAWFDIAKLHSHFNFEQCKGTITLDMPRKSHTLHIAPKQSIDQTIQAWHTFIQDPSHYQKGENTTLYITFTLEGVFDSGIGPYRRKKCVLKTKNILGSDGKSFSTEVVGKRFRTTYSFVR